MKQLFNTIAVVMLLAASTNAQYLFEDFEGGTIPEEWTTEYVYGSIDWICTTGGYDGNPSSAHSGTYNLRLYESSTIGYTTKLIIDTLDLSSTTSAQLKFWHTQAVWADDQDKLRIYYKSNPTDEWTMIPNAEWTTNTPVWTERIIELPNISSTYIIAFEGIASYGYGVTIDDVTIEDIPSCPPPINLFATIIDTYTAELLWEEFGEATTWNIQWDTTNFTLGTGNMINSVTDQFYTLNGLEENTTYDFYIQADCNGTTSTWSGPYNFRTAWSGDNCSTPIYVTLPADAPYADTNQTTVGRGDNYNTTCLSSYDGGEDIVYQIDVTEDIIVNITMDPKTTTYTGILIDNICPGSEGTCEYSSTSSSAIPHKFSLITLTAGTHYIMIDTWPSPANIPSFDLIIEVVPCPDPINLDVQNIGPDVADLSWEEYNDASIWNIQWDTANFVIGTGNVINDLTSTTYTLTNIGPDTTYQFYVQSDCSGGELSDWTGPYSFTTLPACAQPTDLGYENITHSSVDLFWTEVWTANLWNIEWDTTGFSLGTGNTITNINTNTYNIIDLLTPETTYDFYIQADCDGDGTSEWSGPITLTTTATCPVPVDLTISNITHLGADFTWEGFGGSLWDMEIGETPFTPTGIPTHQDINNPTTISNLNPSTEYDVYLRTDCGTDSTEWIGPITFTTNMAPLSNPTDCGLGFPITGGCFNVPISVTSTGTALGTDILVRNVNVIIPHIYVSDITLSLESPNGVIIDLTSSNGGSGDNYGDTIGGCINFTQFHMFGTNGPITDGSAPFIGSYIPEGDFSDFNDGSDPNGIWILHVCDTYASADDGTFQSAEIVLEAPSTETDILSYSFPQQTTPATINPIAHTINIEVGFGTDPATLIADFTLSNGASATILSTEQISEMTENDFTNPVTYHVLAEDNMTFEDWTINVSVADIYTETDILTFSLQEETEPATINNTNHTVNINVNWEADVTSLIANYTLSYGASSFINGIETESMVTEIDYTLPVTDSIVAEDGITYQNWTITVTQDLPPQGALCEDPILLTLPVINETGDTEGYGDDYGNDLGGNPCDNYYLNGDDIVYEFTINEAGALNGNISTNDTYLGLSVYDGCPNDPQTNCILSATSYQSYVDFTNEIVMPGTYLLIVSSYPAPQSIDYDFSMDFTPLPIDLDIIFPTGNDSSCNFTGNDIVPMFLENTGDVFIPTGDTIFTYYQIEENPVVSDTLILTEDLAVNDTLFYFFDETADFSELQSFNYEMWFSYHADTTHSNDTLSGNITHWNFMFEFPEDTILTDNWPYTITAGNEYSEYLWSTGAVDSEIVVNTPGWYSLTVTNNEDCVATDSIYIDLINEIELKEIGLYFNIHPNPASENFTIEISDINNSNYSIEIINTLGQVLYTKDISNSTSIRETIDISEFTPGIHYIQIGTNNTTQVKKLIIQ